MSDLSVSECAVPAAAWCVHFRVLCKHFCVKLSFRLSLLPAAALQLLFEFTCFPQEAVPGKRCGRTEGRAPFQMLVIPLPEVEQVNQLVSNSPQHAKPDPGSIFASVAVIKATSADTSGVEDTWLMSCIHPHTDTRVTAAHGVSR